VCPHFASVVEAESAMARSLPSLLPPLATLAVSACALLCGLKLLVEQMGGINFLIGFLGLFATSIGIAMFEWGYGWRPAFEGITVNVREPYSKFSGMTYNFDPSNFGTWNVFTQLFFVHFSAILVPIELFIHEAMGHDHDRAEDDCDNLLPEGMMAQEMNHGKCQILYSKAAEEQLGYPAGWRRLWKIILFDVMPLSLRRAFIAYVEAGFIVLTNFCGRCPASIDVVFAEPRWVWKWHLTEESEHCWDSVPDMMAHCGVGWRLFMWSAAWLLMALLMFPMATFEGFIYGRKTILKNPLSLPCSLVMLFLFFGPLLFLMQACIGLHIVLGMRPSDEKYHSVCKNMKDKVFSELTSQFRVTHVQRPKEHLKQSEIHRLSVTAKSIMVEKRLASVAVGTFQAPHGNTTLDKTRTSSVQSLGSYRKLLYNQTMEELMAAGLTEDELEQSPFHLVQERLAGMTEYEPPMCE